MRLNQFHKKFMGSNSGSAMFMAMGVLAMTGFVAYYIADQQAKLAASIKYTQITADIRGAKAALLQNISCTRSLDPTATGTNPPPACVTDGAAVTLRDYAGDPITDIGRLHLTATCSTSGAQKGIRIAAEVRNPDNSVARHPLKPNVLLTAPAVGGANESFLTIADSTASGTGFLCSQMFSGGSGSGCSGSILTVYESTRISACPGISPQTTYSTGGKGWLNQYSCVYEKSYPNLSSTNGWADGWQDALFCPVGNINPAICAAANTLKPGCTVIGDYTRFLRGNPFDITMGFNDSYVGVICKDTFAPDRIIGKVCSTSN